MTEKMTEGLQELTLPMAIITRIIKESLPSGVNVSKDARRAITRAATVFILYATSSASMLAVEGCRRALTGEDVIQSMDAMDFPEFQQPLKDMLASYQKKQKEKSEVAAKKRKEKLLKKKEELQQEKEDVDNKTSEVVQMSAESVNVYFTQ